MHSACPSCAITLRSPASERSSHSGYVHQIFLHSFVTLHRQLCATTDAAESLQGMASDEEREEAAQGREHLQDVQRRLEEVAGDEALLDHPCLQPDDEEQREDGRTLRSKMAQRASDPAE